MKTLKVKNRFEFEQLIEDKDFRISQAIVEGIFANLNNKKRFINVLDIDYTEENQITSVTLDRMHFAQTLEENLQHYEAQELFEDCQKIKNTINLLKQKNK